VIALLIFIVGIPSALSFGIWSEYTILGKSIFDAFDFLVSNILMPLGALLIAVFVPLKMKRETLLDELKVKSGAGRKLFVLWLLLLKYLAPLAILCVFLYMVGFM
jgi:NSS family neurotransmitter:Na+ symporter